MHKLRSKFNFQNLYQAYLNCRRFKRHTHHALKFEEKLETEILLLERDLQNQSYQIGRSICFVVTNPTLREVFAATFRDRVVHHLLYNFLEPIFEPKFIAQSFACRKGKGIHPSLKCLKKYLRQATKNNQPPVYFLHLDIKGFFMSLRKDILLKQIQKSSKDPELIWLTKLIIKNDPTKNFVSKSSPALLARVPPHKSLFHIPQNQGLPIGNLTSQFFANVYLNELDHFAKRQLKCRYYLRYVDDILLLSPDPKQLKAWRDQIEIFIKNHLALDLNLKKQILQPVTKGIDWLGYIVTPDHTRIRPRVVRAFKRQLFLSNKNLRALANSKQTPTKKEVEEILALVNSYFGFFRHADSFRLRTKLWTKHFSLIKNFLEPKPAETLGHPHELTSFKIREDFLKKIRESPT